MFIILVITKSKWDLLSVSQLVKNHCFQYSNIIVSVKINLFLPKEHFHKGNQDNCDNWDVFTLSKMYHKYKLLYLKLHLSNHNSADNDLFKYKLV